MLKSLFGALTALCCLSCSQLLFSSHPLCKKCQQQWLAIERHFHGNLLALRLYQGSLRQLVLRAKQEALSPSTFHLAHGLNQARVQIPVCRGTFVPVPARFSRRWRSWSLPHFLAKFLSQSKQWNYRPVLGRGINSQPQATKTGDQCCSGMKQQLYLKKSAGESFTSEVWLVDDVGTTGATLAEARRGFGVPRLAMQRSPGVGPRGPNPILYGVVKAEDLN